MKTSAFLGVLAMACLGLAMLYTPGVRVLGASEAEAVSGGVEIWPYKCTDVGSCDEYNPGIVKTCPDDYCMNCEFGDERLWQCTYRPGTSYRCNFLGNQGTDCGKRKVGVCNGSTCENQIIIEDDYHCSDGPYCEAA